MNNNRSVYQFRLNSDQLLINNLVQNFLQQNNFKLITKNGEQIYQVGDAIISGYRYFKYLIQDNVLYVYAWLPGNGQDISLDVDGLNPKVMAYRESLSILFQEIQKLNEGKVSMNFDPNTGEPINNQNSSNNFVSTFQEQNIKKQEKFCEIGFWLSLFGLICSFVGVSYGVIIYILNFYFASQGLKTRKRGKAITTIVLSIISILICILWIINA